MGDKLPYRARDADASRQAILSAARIEFAKAGLAGARVDQIAEASGINKRMIYHYFGGKEQLFAAVVEDAYVDIRSQEHELGLDSLGPTEALRKLVEFTWAYYLANPEFITLINSENLHQARHIAGNRELRRLQKNYVETVDAILRRGVATGEFRAGIDPVQLCLTIASVCFYYLNNRHTGAVIFGFDFMSRKALDARLRFNVESVLRIVLAKP